MSDRPISDGKIWSLQQLSADQTRAYHEFLRIPAMSLGIYQLPAGAVDGQSPHTEDEAYYVVSGKAKMFIAGEITPIQSGAIIFVAAHVEHRFIEIEEDLTIIVFFAPAEYSGKP